MLGLLGCLWSPRITQHPCPMLSPPHAEGFSNLGGGYQGFWLLWGCSKGGRNQAGELNPAAAQTWILEYFAPS